MFTSIVFRSVPDVILRDRFRPFAVFGVVLIMLTHDHSFGSQQVHVTMRTRMDRDGYSVMGFCG